MSSWGYIFIHFQELISNIYSFLKRVASFAYELCFFLIQLLFSFQTKELGKQWLPWKLLGLFNRVFLKEAEAL